MARQAKEAGGYPAAFWEIARGVGEGKTMSLAVSRRDAERVRQLFYGFRRALMRENRGDVLKMLRGVKVKIIPMHAPPEQAVQLMFEPDFHEGFEVREVAVGKANESTGGRYDRDKGRMVSVQEEMMGVEKEERVKPKKWQELTEDERKRVNKVRKAVGRTEIAEEWEGTAVEWDERGKGGE